MKSLFAYLVEGGASGHMMHPYDYNEWTLRDVKGLIRNLFSGRLEDITEKVDGANIQATMNSNGEVVFIRNKTDLNSARGGMTIEDMAAKWSSKPDTAKTFLTAGETITQVFTQIGPKFFNPSDHKKLVANCECVLAGKTNIMYYASSQVDFHNIWVYEKDENGEWKNTDVTKDGLSVIEKACEKVDNANITPQVIIQVAKDAEKLLVERIKELDKLFKADDCRENSTLEDYKFHRFSEYIKNHYKSIDDEEHIIPMLFARYMLDDKSTNIRELKKLCGDDVMSAIEKDSKDIKSYCMQPLDDFFIALGNQIIGMCEGIINDGAKDEVVQQLKNDLKDAVNTVNAKGDADLQAKMLHQLSRFSEDTINPIEGIVFKYKGKLTKLTGTFGPLNQVLGYQYK